MPQKTKYSLSHLDNLAQKRIKAYFDELVTNADDILTEEDLGGAAHHVESLYLDHTDLSVSDCMRRAMDLAEPIKQDIMRKQQGFGV
jgi:hypothetical protein